MTRAKKKKSKSVETLTHGEAGAAQYPDRRIPPRHGGGGQGADPRGL